MSGLGDFLTGAAVGGLTGVNKAIEDENKYRRQMSLEEWRLERKQFYDKMTRDAIYKESTDPDRVAWANAQAAEKIRIEGEARTQAEIDAAIKKAGDPDYNAAVTSIAETKAVAEAQAKLTAEQKVIEQELANQWERYNKTNQAALEIFGEEGAADRMVSIFNEVYGTAMKTPTENAALLAPKGGRPNKMTDAGRDRVVQQVVADSWSVNVEILNNIAETAKDEKTRNTLMGSIADYTAAVLGSDSSSDEAIKAYQTLLSDVSHYSNKGELPQGKRLLDYLVQANSNLAEMSTLVAGLGVVPTGLRSREERIKAGMNWIKGSEDGSIGYNMQGIRESIRNLATGAGGGSIEPQPQGLMAPDSEDFLQEGAPLEEGVPLLTPQAPPATQEIVEKGTEENQDVQKVVANDATANTQAATESVEKEYAEFVKAAASAIVKAVTTRKLSGAQTKKLIEARVNQMGLSKQESQRLIERLTEEVGAAFE